MPLPAKPIRDEDGCDLYDYETTVNTHVGVKMIRSNEWQNG